MEHRSQVMDILLQYASVYYRYRIIIVPEVI